MAAGCAGAGSMCGGKSATPATSEPRLRRPAGEQANPLPSHRPARRSRNRPSSRSRPWRPSPRRRPRKGPLAGRPRHRPRSAQELPGELEVDVGNHRRTARPSRQPGTGLEEYTAEPQALHFIWKSSRRRRGQGRPGDVADRRHDLHGEHRRAMAAANARPSPAPIRIAVCRREPSHPRCWAACPAQSTSAGERQRHRHQALQVRRESDRPGGLRQGVGRDLGGEDGGYVVKDVVNWEGGAGLFGARHFGR